MARPATRPPDWVQLHLRLPMRVLRLLDEVTDVERDRNPGRRVPRQEVAVAILEAGARRALAGVSRETP